MIKALFLGVRFPAGALASFLAPLDRGLPGPLLPRPVRSTRMERALTSAFVDPDPSTLAPLFASLAGGVEEARVVIAAAYDTTAHTLAFALWELAARPDFNVLEGTNTVVQETLRLYPAGWIGSRVSFRDTEFNGRAIPAGRLVLYSPYLTHRDPELWSKPLDFAPDRFTAPLPAWGYLPFAAGERTCLGAALATLMLRAAVKAFIGSGLSRISSQMRPCGVLTLTPDGPILLRRRVTGGNPAQAESTVGGDAATELPRRPGGVRPWHPAAGTTAAGAGLPPVAAGRAGHPAGRRDLRALGLPCRPVRLVVVRRPVPHRALRRTTTGGGIVVLPGHTGLRNSDL